MPTLEMVLPPEPPLRLERSWVSWVPLPRVRTRLEPLRPRPDTPVAEAAASRSGGEGRKAGGHDVRCDSAGSSRKRGFEGGARGVPRSLAQRLTGKAALHGGAVHQRGHDLVGGLVVGQARQALAAAEGGAVDGLGRAVGEGDDDLGGVGGVHGDTRDLGTAWGGGCREGFDGSERRRANDRQRRAGAGQGMEAPAAAVGAADSPEPDREERSTGYTWPPWVVIWSVVPLRDAPVIAPLIFRPARGGGADGAAGGSSGQVSVSGGGGGSERECRAGGGPGQRFEGGWTAVARKGPLT
jgi:hypothetical protein